MTITLPTIAIKRSDGKGKKIINFSDYDPGKHELWVPEDIKTEKIEPVQEEQKNKRKFKK